MVVVRGPGDGPHDPPRLSSFFSILETLLYSYQAVAPLAEFIVCSRGSILRSGIVISVLFNIQDSSVAV